MSLRRALFRVRSNRTVKLVLALCLLCYGSLWLSKHQSNVRRRLIDMLKEEETPVDPALLTVYTPKYAKPGDPDALPPPDASESVVAPDVEIPADAPQFQNLPEPKQQDSPQKRRAYPGDANSKRTGPGEDGVPVKLSDDEAVKGAELYKAWFMNIMASDKISPDRSLPDMRPHACKSVLFDDDLPSVSVVIIFHNEWLSALLRTVHSVLLRSDPSFIHEIILMDDASDRELLAPLEAYIKRWEGKVKLVRSKQRIGLIRARIEGAKPATGDVLLFLESHCEVTIGWLEPLLQRLKEKPTAVVMPKIDGIDNNDFHYLRSPTLERAVGGFWWSLFFKWIEPRESNTDPVVPLKSPTMPGGIFAMYRQYFFDLGAYDEGMEIWGGENLEISFRIWMCGGSLEFLLCSHVGHVFRSGHPYNMTKKDVHGFNSVRLAEVWLDDYKRLYYNYRHTLKHANVGNLTPRIELRQHLKCHSFQWYLQNVYPQKFVPDENAFAWGHIKHSIALKGDQNLCLDTLQRNEKFSFNVGIYACQEGGSSAQLFTLTKDSMIRREDNALVYGGSSSVGAVQLVPFNDGETPDSRMMWTHSKAHGSIKHKDSGLCLDMSGRSSGDDLMLTTCDYTSVYQKWAFENYSES